ncbi:MAG: SDR family oxidoreductase [Bacteroidia bacterium]
MNSTLRDKVVIITGASSGIGRACALTFSAAGAHVVLAGRNLDKLGEVAGTIKKNGCAVLVIPCDVTHEEDCKNLMNAAMERFKKIDVLICNAGISMRATFADVDLKVIRLLMETNFWGAVYCTKYALPYLLNSQGSVVAISSIAGKMGLPGRTGYSASKYALEGFMETLRTENLKNHLHVLVARPGFTRSAIREHALAANGIEQRESPRDEDKMMSADEVSKHILNAVLKRKRDLILTKNGKLTVWINKFFPALMDKLVYDHMSKEPGSPFKPV